MKRTFVSLAASAAVVGLLAIGAGPAIAAEETATPAPTPAPTADVEVGIQISEVSAGKVTLQRGDKGPAVTDVQVRLFTIGILIPETGTYDEVTVKAVKRFQWKFLLPQTGKVDKKTYSALRSLSSGGDRISKCQARKSKGINFCADQKLRILRIFEDGVQTETVDVRFGGAGALHTRNGTYVFFRQKKDDYSTLYHVRMPYASYFSNGQAVHLSVGFVADGYRLRSHGCIGTNTYANAIKLYNMVTVGKTKISVYES